MNIQSHIITVQDANFEKEFENKHICACYDSRLAAYEFKKRTAYSAFIYFYYNLIIQLIVP